MEYTEFCRQLGKAGLNIREFAELLKMSPNGIRNCVSKGVVPSHLGVIAVLFGEMAERHIDFKEIISKVEITAKKPRGPQGRPKES